MAAVLLGLAVLLLVGSASVFAVVHAVPGFAAAQEMRGRFWGGPGLYFHPNAMAGLAVVAAARIGPDRAFAGWQRLAVTALAGFLLFLTNSRTPWSSRWWWRWCTRSCWWWPPPRRPADLPAPVAGDPGPVRA